MSKQGFLAGKVANHDVVMVRVMSSPCPQVLRATVGKVYSAGKGIDRSFRGTEIEFVRAPGNWGDVPLDVGDEAILFISKISNKLYEDAWRGHMVVEEIDAERYAIFQHRELWLSEEVPPVIRDNSRQDPKRPYATAISLGVLEAYLLELIEKTDRCEP